MPTTKERILVTLTPELARDIRALARREKSPRATVAARLMREAMEDIEDRYFSALGDKRMNNLGRLYSHEEVWGTKKTRRK